MMARKKIVILVAGLAALAMALGVGLGGCKDLTFNGDMKGYLEYWTGTVQVGRVDVTNVALQKNDAGVDILPLSATATITGYIINPSSMPLCQK